MVLDDSGLSLFVDGHLTEPDAGGWPPSLNVSGVTVDPHGVLWIATRNTGLVKIGARRVTKVSTMDGVAHNHVWS